MGSCYSSASHNLSPSTSAPFSRAPISPQLPSSSPFPSPTLRTSPLTLALDEETLSHLLLFRSEPKITASHPLRTQIKVDSSSQTPAPSFTAVALSPDEPQQTPAAPSLTDLRPRKVNFKSPLTSPLKSPGKVHSPRQNRAKGKHRKASRLLSHLRSTVWRRKEKPSREVDDCNNNIETVTKDIKVPDDVEGVEESLVICLPASATTKSSSSNHTKSAPYCTSTFAFHTTATVSYVSAVELVHLSPSSSLVSRLFRRHHRVRAKSKSTSEKQPAARMATSNTNRPSALKPPSQLSKLTAQFGFGSRQLPTLSNNSEKPPALPPKLTASKLRAPTSNLPMYNSKLLGSKSIGNVSAAVSSELTSVPTFTPANTANSCDNLTTKPRSSTSDISAASDASSQTLSSASSVSSFKKASNLGQVSTQGRRLLSPRSAFFDANRGAQTQKPDSRFSNRSSSSSNISADSGHNSSSSGGPISSKSTHNLSTKTTVPSSNQSKSLLPTSKAAIQQSTASAKAANMHTHSANIPQAKKPQTAHIVSTPGPVIVDRGAAAISSPRLPNVPNAASQFPSMTKFAAHQSQLHSQRMQFFYGATSSVSNGHQYPHHVVKSGVPVQQISATNNYHTYLPELGHSVAKNGTSGPTIAVPVTRRAPALKSPAHHGILHPELHKPYKRPTTTASTLSSNHHHQQQNGGYQALAPTSSSAVPNGTLVMANVRDSTLNHNTAYSGYNQSYVRNAVNRLNSNNQLQSVYASEPGPPLPPKGIPNGYSRSYSHPPDVNGNIAPVIPPKGLGFRASNHPDRVLARQTERQLSIQEHRSEGEAAPHLQSLEFADVVNGNVVEDDLSSSEYSSLTYNVRRRIDHPHEQQQQQPTAVVTSGIRTSKSSPLHQHLYQHSNPTLVQQSSLGKLRAPQLVASAVVATAAAAATAGTVGRTETANSVVLSPPPPSSSADSRRLKEMSFVAALVSRQQLAAAAAAQQTATATCSSAAAAAATAVTDSSHQDDTDVEEELLSCGEDSEPVSCASSSHESHHHHHHNHQHHQQQHKSTCSPHHLMSASLCSTASTTSSFCFEGNGNTSSQDSCTSSGSQTPGPGRKARTESSASCTTLSQESTKDWIDDEIADQPDLFMTSGSPPKEAGGHQSGDSHSNGRSKEASAGAIADINGDEASHSLLLKRHHFHLNFPQPTLSSPSKTGTPMDDSVTPTNSYPSPLRSANYELESLILQHSPKCDDHYTSLPPLNYSQPHHHHNHHPHARPAVDRSRSFSFNHANNGQMSSASSSTASTTPNGPMSPAAGAPFGSPRVANLEKRHSYTAASSTSNHQTVTSTTPSYAIFRRPRPLSFVETADGNLGLDSPSLRAVSQDVIGIKTLLFRLQGVLQNAETQNPFESSIRNHHHHNHQFVSNRSSLDSLHSHERTYSNCSESSDRTFAPDPESMQALREENFDLRQELKLLQEEMIDKDRTIRLLQQQMAKYSTGYVEPINDQTGERRPELTNSTTQTEACSTEGGINPRALSDGSNGQLVRAWIEENLNVNLSLYEDSKNSTAQD